MKRINVSMILICLILTGSSTLIYSQDTIKYKKVKNEKRNSWSLGLNYGENGFGPYAGLYSSLGRTTDLVFSISVSGVTDEREIERFDVFGNSVVVNKINRVFMMPLSIGIRKELFKDDIDGDFLPIFNIGVAPTLVLTNPYNESYFAAFGNTKTYFAFGGFAGFGVSFSQNKSMCMNVNFNYYYLPVVGDGVQSLQYSTINDVGGLQLSLGVIFLN